MESQAAGSNSKRNVDVSFQHLCAVLGCNSQRRYVDVSFHVFPKNVAVREKWIEFLGHGNVKKHTWVCSQHFTQDCFYNWQEKKMGFASKLILKPDAVPSIRTQLSRQAVSEPHEEHMSRVFDEVMGLGEFADSSRGSVSSSKSSDPIEQKELDETSGHGESQPMEEDSSCRKQEEKVKEEAGDSDKHSSFQMMTSKRGSGGSGGAASDDALDGLPAFEPEEDENWHYALPLGTAGDAAKANSKTSQCTQDNTSTKKDCFPRKPGEDEEGEQEREASQVSANTSHSSQDNTPDNSRDEGILNQTEETEDSQQEETSETAPVEDGNTPASPGITIKDEPVDEGYDAALLPQSSTKQIKEELDQQEEELRISSVYSVGGANTFTSNTIPAAVSAPAQTTIFIPGRGAVLQAMTSLPVRQPAPVARPIPTLTMIPQRPPPPQMAGSVRCSGCSKVLLKGQTAFQRKGSTQLFCSTVCLTGHLPPAVKNRNCFQCNREIAQPRDMITIPAEDNTLMSFCGQFCLSVFRHRKKTIDRIPDKWPDKRLEKKPEKPLEKPLDRLPEKLFCSVCKITNRQIEHEVTHQGRLHRLCSDACFVTWRKLRQLSMNCCEGCGLYCNSNSGSSNTLSIERSHLNFCSPTCIGTYIHTCKKTTECGNCHKIAVVSSTIMERDQKGKIRLYCSRECVEDSRPRLQTLVGAPFPCSLCKVSAVPQYHLALLDGTIRNFCSYNCVTTYRKSGPPSQPDLSNGTSSSKDPPSKDLSKQGSFAVASSVPPIPQDHSSLVPFPGHHPSHSSVPPLVPPPSAMSSTILPGQTQAISSSAQLPKLAEGGRKDAIKLTCNQCNKHFNTKPLLFSHQGHISLLCSVACSEKYKIEKNILALCDGCKQEKGLFDTITYNQEELFFCSENCKVLFKHNLTLRNKDHTWHSCSYCSGFSSKMLHSHYGGKIEQFCKPHCMSQYTVLHYGMSRCDSCRKQGYLTEMLQCLGSVRNFCNMSCLLHYCFLYFEMSQHANSNGTGTAAQTPCTPTQPHHSSKMNPVIADVVSLANGSAAQPSMFADTAMTGALPTSNIDGRNLDHASTQTDATRPPAHRRRQMKNKSVLCRPFTVDQEIMCQLPEACTESRDVEKVKVVMFPVPVPVYIPVPVNVYSQDMPVPVVIPIPVPVPIAVPPQTKEMTDAAVQSEVVAADEEKQEKEFASCAVQSDASCFGGVEQTHKAGQMDKSSDSAESQPDNQSETSTGKSDSSAPNAKTEAPPSPLMDLESDFPLELLEHKPPVLQRGVKRPREGSFSRKRGRKRAASAESSALAAPATSTINHLYGLKAWKNWVHQCRQQPQESCSLDFKEDILQYDSTELSFALSRFIKELRRPNGDTYSPDSIFYLCLGIQQYIFLKGRIENIFTDELYGQFASEISAMLQLWKPKLLPNGGVVPSRVEESFLWECKQLGAYSPIVLLNTLLFFCTKKFHLTTVEQHRHLSFSNFTRRSKPCNRAGKVCYLHYRRSTTSPDQTVLFRKQRLKEEDLEMLENVTYPLHCPVRLYEFYLSRCPESVRDRTDVFYLQPEKNVHTDSCHWYSPQPLDAAILQTMLTRILAVREVQQELEAARHRCSTDGDAE
ncbi:zinc finger MYM-type protein 4 isoform X1 [Oryzias latipes]|uniref:zinc finger MYM-type protein 4 isoform X1 n=1 Tax=Oryzias latipes TaxID=8090 RepID=UPI0005CB8737|nr:zinc finger MYM-type protein 4 isoform X1 [Oryzias latipes]